MQLDPSTPLNGIIATVDWIWISSPSQTFVLTAGIGSDPVKWPSAAGDSCSEQRPADRGDPAHVTNAKPPPAT